MSYSPHQLGAVLSKINTLKAEAGASATTPLRVIDVGQTLY